MNREIPIYKVWCLEWGDTSQHDYPALNVKAAAALHARHLGRTVSPSLWPDGLRIYVTDPVRKTTYIVSVKKVTTVDFEAVDQTKAR